MVQIHLLDNAISLSSWGKNISGELIYVRVWCYLAEYRDAFSLFDTEGDGKIDVEQIGSVLRSLNLNPADEDILKIEKDVGKLFPEHRSAFWTNTHGWFIALWSVIQGTLFTTLVFHQFGKYFLKEE